jgi:hypothetical protein
MVNDNTPSPKRRRPRKVKKPRVTPRAIRNLKVIARAQRRILKRNMHPAVREAIEDGIAELETWIKAYGG